MDEQLAGRQARGYRRVSTQVMQLGNDVFLGEHLHAFMLATAGTVVLDHCTGNLGMAQPGLDRWHLLETLRV
ncbi:hypothetical protein D3C81_586890 [compost metagenome]